jgi:hypothetical protein
MSPQLYARTPFDMKNDGETKEALFLHGRVKCFEEEFTGKEVATLMALIIKELMPYLGRVKTHFKHLTIECQHSDRQVNGSTTAYYILETNHYETSQMGCRILLNLKILKSGEAILSTFIHELAHALTYKPFTMVSQNVADGGHNEEFYNMNFHLLKYVKRIPFFTEYFDVNHESMNIYKTVSYT